MMGTSTRACLSCGTAGGNINRSAGGRAPRRTHGLCHRCAERARKLGIIDRYPSCGDVPVPGERHAWTSAEDEYLRFAVSSGDPAGVAEHLGRTTKAIQNRANTLGLHFREHPARFWAQVEQTAGCWRWLGARRRRGYGAYSLDGTQLVAHRVAYELVRGPIPNGFGVHHNCGNTACVNPAHLTAVARREHLLLHDSPPSLAARQTHCKHGHTFTPANTYVDARGHRACRTCGRERMAAFRAKRGAA